VVTQVGIGLAWHHDERANPMVNELRCPRIEFPPISSGLHVGRPGTAHHLSRLPNNYGLSVVHNPEAQGEDTGRWEASVIVFDGPGATATRWSRTSSTPTYTRTSPISRSPRCW
jgi:hypothetical protein